MKTTKLWLVAMIFLAFAAVSCDNTDDPDPVNEAQLLVEYLESAEGGNYANTAMAAIKTADVVKTGATAGTMYLVDVRAADDYANGHVAGAVNVSLGEVWAHLEGTTDDDGKEVILICYSGQSAAWGTALLRMVGYDNVWSMKWGMCSWSTETAGSWNNSTANTYASAFEDVAVPKGEAGDLPVLNTGFTTGKEILEARVAEVFAEGFKEAAIGAGDVFGALESNYIVNYWAEADYVKYGHIPGAMQYTPKASISLDADLKTLPADEQVVVYCWTGQTSANMAAYLRVIGYNAKSLKFGSNAMIYDELEGHKWSETAIMGYDVATD